MKLFGRSRSSGPNSAGTHPAKKHKNVLVAVLMSAIMGGLAILGSTSALGQTECTVDPAITSCTQDETTTADLAQLRRLVRTQFAPLGGEGPDPARLNIKFIGKGRTNGFTNEEPALESTDYSVGTGPGRRITAWRMFNPATKNEFEIEVPEATRQVFDAMLMRGDPKPASPAGPSPERPTTAFSLSSWSGGVDDRVRRTDNETYPWRTIADMGGCTATFVGPRQIVTAGHCIYNRGTAATPTTPASPPAWMPNFSVRPQRDAGDVPFITTMPPGPGQEGWYFTPVGWRDPNLTDVGQFDIAVVVVPDRLGEQVSWMGYGTLGAAELQQGSPLMLRGYPYCESETAAPRERIDEPVIPGQPAPDFGCVKNGFYVGSQCSVGAFSKTDPDNWARRVRHGCDAGAANSGSSLYVYYKGNPMVVGIHTTSTKCSDGPDPGASPPTTADPPCTSSDTHPLEMTRITPEYRGWISYFRAMFP